MMRWLSILDSSSVLGESSKKLFTQIEFPFSSILWRFPRFVVQWRLMTPRFFCGFTIDSTLSVWGGDLSTEDF
jgi:hypothetical protein